MSVFTSLTVHKTSIFNLLISEEIHFWQPLKPGTMIVDLMLNRISLQTLDDMRDESTDTRSKDLTGIQKE